jgi:ABC-type glycerol-3-phosphate transport system permease component
MRTIPGDIIDAARVDGYSEFRIYWQIILPLTLPALATLQFTGLRIDYVPANISKTEREGEWAFVWGCVTTLSTGRRRGGRPTRG